MENSPYIGWVTLAASLIMLWLTRRGVRRKQVTGNRGQILTPSEPGYYIKLAGYILAGLALLAVALRQFTIIYGFSGLFLALLGVGVPGYLILRYGRLKHVLGFLLRRPAQPQAAAAPPKAAQPAPTPRQWALSALALISRVKGQDISLLGGQKPSPWAEKTAERRLAREWDIHAVDDFDEVSSWLFEVGHRTDFHAFIQQITGMDAGQVRTFLEETDAGLHGYESAQEQEEVRHRVEMIRSNKDNIRYISFMAWDMLRYMDLCRIGYLAGYLDEDDTWDRLLTAGQVLQSRYDSWEDLNDQFLLAREFWSCVEDERDGHVYRKAFERLHDDEKSPWRQIAWGLPLFHRA